MLDEGDEVGVLHLLPDAVVAEQAAVHGQAGVQRVQAGRDLHGVGLLGRVAVREDDAALIERGTTVGEGVLDDEVMGLLGVREARESRAGLGLGDLQVVETLLDEGVLGLGRGVGGDAVNHGPREAHASLVGDVVDEALRHEAVGEPAVGNGEDGVAETATVLGEVVGGNHGDRRGAGLIALKEQLGDDAHRAGRGRGALGKLLGDEREELAGGVVQPVALLGDREGDELELRAAEVGLGALKVLGPLGVGEHGVGGGGQHALVERAVGLHDDLK